MEDKIKIEPKSVRGSSANFINVLGVAMSGLAILAIIFTLVMTQISLNGIALSLEAIEEKLEVNEEDIEAIREIEPVMTVEEELPVNEADEEEDLTELEEPVIEEEGDEEAETDELPE